MAARNSRESALQKDMFSAFDEIVLDVQRLEREFYSEKTLCEKLNRRLKELDAEETKIVEQTNNLFAKREENFKKEVDVQAALDCITKTLQLEKVRHAGLRHQLDRANNKAVEQNLRLAAKEEKYGALWDSYKAVYESFPLVTEVNRITDLVKHDKIKLMQANSDLREAHNHIVQMHKISELAKKVEMVKMAEVFSEHAASERRVEEMQRQMSQLQASVGRGMERKQQLLARPAAKPATEPAQGTLPATRVAALPVASCTGQASEKYTSLLNPRSLPQVPSLATAYSRQASLDIVRARYAKQSWPRDNNVSSFPTDESRPNISVPLATAASTAPLAMDCTLPNSRTSRETPSLPSDMEYSSQAKSCEVPMQVECSSQGHLDTREVAMEISASDSQIPVLPGIMEHSTQRPQPGNIPMEQNEIDSPLPSSQTKEVPTGINEVAIPSQSQSQANQAPIHQSRMELSYQELLSDTDIPMPTTAPELLTTKALPAKLPIETGGSTLPNTNSGGTRIPHEERTIIAGMPLRESMTEISSRSFKWPVSSLTPETVLRAQEPTSEMSASQSGVPDGNVATGTSGSDPQQVAEGDDDMDEAPSLSQVSLIGSQEEFSTCQHSSSNRISRVEYLKKLRQSPEFHYAPRLMFNRQEAGTQEIGSASPYFQPLVSEANAHRHQAEPLLRENEHSNDLQAQPNQQMQSHQQNEQFPSQSVQSQLPSQQLQIRQTQGNQSQAQQFPKQTLQGQQLPVQQFPNQTPLCQQSQARQCTSQPLQSQPPQVHQSLNQNLQGNHELGQQFPNHKSLEQQVLAQQFDHRAMRPSTDQESQFPTYKEGLAEMQQPGGGQRSAADAARMSQLSELHNQNDFPVGSQDHGSAQPTGQFGSQDNGIHAQTTRQYGSQNAGIAQTANQFRSENNDITPIASQFGSQNNANAQAVVNQLGSQNNQNVQQTSQSVQQNIASPPSSQTINEDNERYTPKQVLSQSNNFFYTPRQSQGDGVRMEMGDGDFESPLSAFTSPGEALILGNKDPAAPDTHDSSSNESFQYKSPSCTPPPTESAGFNFMGSAPSQQTSMFGAPVDPQNGGGDAQQKPRSEAFMFNFSSNSSKPSVFKLF